jgi:hypothetical protein
MAFFFLLIVQLVGGVCLSPIAQGQRWLDIVEERVVVSSSDDALDVTAYKSCSGEMLLASEATDANPGSRFSSYRVDADLLATALRHGVVRQVDDIRPVARVDLVQVGVRLQI